MEENSIQENVFENFVDNLFVKEGKPFRQLPIICRYIEQLWSTFLVYYSSKSMGEKFVALLDYGMCKMKVCNTLVMRPLCLVESHTLDAAAS